LPATPASAPLFQIRPRRTEKEQRRVLLAPFGDVWRIDEVEQPLSPQWRSSNTRPAVLVRQRASRYSPPRENACRSLARCCALEPDSGRDATRPTRRLARILKMIRADGGVSHAAPTSSSVSLIRPPMREDLDRATIRDTVAIGQAETFVAKSTARGSLERPLQLHTSRLFPIPGTPSASHKLDSSGSRRGQGN